MERIRELENNQWKTKEQLLELQRLKLVRLLTHAYKNVPFYRKRFNAFAFMHDGDNILEGFAKLPLLTKREINENRDEMVAVGAGKDLRLDQTSGSTGEALFFFTDLRSRIYKQAALTRNLRWLGIDLGDRTAALWGAPMDLSKAQRVRERLHTWLMNSMMLSSYSLTEEQMARYERELRLFKPLLLLSYPGPLTLFSEYLSAVGKPVESIKVIICSAETLSPWQKQTIEKAFQRPVFNRYACREFGHIAHECTLRNGWHINVDRLYVEIVDETGTHVGPEEVGEIVITDLDNYGTPLIRYAIGDMGSITVRSCSCGRGLPMLKSLEGRTLDVVVAPNGNRLGGTFWTILFKIRPGIREFQLIQEDTANITVNFVRDTGVRKIPFDFFEKAIQEKCSAAMKVSFREVSLIPRTISGKTRFIVSKLCEPTPARGNIK